MASYTAYKYRMFPTREQQILLAKTFGCVRYVYNRGLAIKMEVYQTTKKGISVFKLTDKMATWKKDQETLWLKEVNSQALQMSLRFLDAAYTNFFKKRASFPRFKSKFDNHQLFCNPQNTTVDWDNGLVCFPKFQHGIKTVLHRKFNGTIKSSYVSKTPSGKYYISILVETDGDLPKLKKPRESKTLGIDLGIKDYATFSDGTVISNPHHFNKRFKALKRAQRKLSRKKKGSNNRTKQRVKVARLHEKVTNCRKDFLHKLTRSIVENQDYNSVAIEDLNVKELLEKRKNKLSRYIADAGWGTFRTFLTYKCERAGKNLLVIGRFEPSSKLCLCGYLNHNLTLKDRVWECPECHTKHQRDVLAALNIRRFAFCKQNTRKELIGQELPESTPLETCVSGSLKEETSKALA